MPTYNPAAASGGGGVGGAPTGATYITQAPHSELSAEQALSTLSDGLLKHTAGVVAPATAGVDYAAVSHNHDAAYEAKNANIQAHVASAHAPADAQKNSDILQAEIEAVLTGEISTHTHAGGGGGGAAWGGVTGTLADQTDLQAALDAKAASADPSFTGTALTLADAQDVVLGSTAGTRIGQSTSKIGFWGTPPVVQPTALVQTYSTASSTHPNMTASAAPAGGVGVAAGGWSTAANRDAAITSINNLRNDVISLKNFVNAAVDRLQASGLLK